MHKFVKELLNGEKVEWKNLGEVSTFYAGLRGKNKYDFENGNAKYVTYKNVFDDLEVLESKLEKVRVFENENQNAIKYGDILFTGSSESLEEVGYCATVTKEFDEEIYLNSFCFGVRFNEDIQLLPEFTKFLFTTEFMRTQIKKTAKGVTRYNISKEKFKNIIIPIVPLQVQKKLVDTLEKFWLLKKALKKEKILREKQYTYYRDKFLTFGEDVDVKTLGDVCESIYAGGTPSTRNPNYWTNGNIPWMSSGEVTLRTITQTEKFITELGLNNSSARYVPENSIVMALAGQGTTRGKVARTKIKLTTNQSLAALIFDYNKVNFNYVYHYLVQQYYNLRQASAGNVGRGGLNLSIIKSYPIPIPAIEEQNKIANILDMLDKLTYDITQGLPREIELREKQYCYYRDQLLNFTEED